MVTPVTKKTNLVFILTLIVTLVSVASSIASAPLPTGTKKQIVQTANYFSEVIERAKPAVVYIHVTKKSDGEKDNPDDELISTNPVLKEWFGDKKRESEESFFTEESKYAFGSGFIFNSGGYILTNSHVIKDGSEVTITLADKTKHKAKIIGSDPKTDIGLLKIDSEDLPYLPLGDSDKEKVGSWVLAIGSPYEFTQTVTAGIISASGRSGVGISDYEDFIQTDAAINPGNSGGPLININGKVIGINTAFLTQTGGYMGIGFAVPINMARLVTEQLIAKGKVTRAWLGVGLVDATPRQLKALGIPAPNGGAKIVKIRKQSPAQRGGFQKKDIITKINGNPIKSAADLRNRISLTSPESLVELEYYRDKKLQTVAVHLGLLE